MSFDRGLLPDAEIFFESEGLRLLGRGVWRQARCDFHGGSDSMRVNASTGGWVCMNCGAKGGDVLAYRMQLHGEAFVEAARTLGAWIEDGQPVRPAAAAAPRPPRPDPSASRELTSDDERKLDLAARIWSSSSPIRLGSPAAAYLTGRNCLLPPTDGDLHFCDDVSVFGFTGPALVGRMSAAEDRRQGQGLHLTWLRRDAGAWSRVDRRYLGRKAGAVVRLWPDEAVTTGLGVAEGIESALALAHGFDPVWACMDAGNLAALPVLPGVEGLCIAVDHDPAGLAAAERCADRWAGAGVTVQLVVPPSERTDLNDMARAA